MKNFWTALANFILQNRIAILVVMGILTAFMAWNSKIDLAQDYGKIVPPSDVDYKIYKDFIKQFGEDGNVIAIGIEGDLHNHAFFTGLYDLTEKLKAIEGLEGVISVTHLFNITKDTVNEKFDLQRVVSKKPSNQAETDSLVSIIENLPFYENLILTKDKKVSVIAVSIDAKALDSKEKHAIFDKVIDAGTAFENQFKTTCHYAGLPVLRVTFYKILPKELLLFLFLAVVVSAVILFIFFRSWVAVVYPLIVVAVINLWAFGLIGLLGYKMTMIMGIIPALITVVGIPNCVYFITKYHYEFSECRDKIQALKQMINKMGVVTVMVNATTIVGLGATAVTDIAILREFGIVAGLTVTVAFFISVFLITIIFSYLPEPTPKQLKHLENKATGKILEKIDFFVQHQKHIIYGMVGLLLILSFWGISKIEVVSKMADDIPKGSRMLSDLRYMEEKLGGTMPFEILVATKDSSKVLKPRVIKDIARLQDSIRVKYPEISRTLSISDFAKFTRQSFNGGAASEYDVPSKSEFTFIGPYLKNSNIESKGKFSKNLTDSSQQKTRISGNIKDIGSLEMKYVVNRLQIDIDSIFDKSKYDVHITGTTRIYIKGNTYLISNLIQSLVLTLFLIGVLMWLTFRTLRGVILSIVPNILPLLMVAGFMGFAGIPLKPSTALVFSIVFGISIDNTIHFLVAYRRHRRHGLQSANAVTATYNNTGLSMIYTSSILFAGFIIFIASAFGATQVLGYLMGGTLLVALFSNLLFLPALVLDFGKEKV